VPVVLNELGDQPGRQLETRGRPRIAKGPDRARILERLARLSEPFGIVLRIDDASAGIDLT
jgi:hypothetical protein